MQSPIIFGTDLVFLAIFPPPSVTFPLTPRRFPKICPSSLAHMSNLILLTEPTHSMEKTDQIEDFALFTSKKRKDSKKDDERDDHPTKKKD
jgi:hypothetical protein